MSDVCYFLRGEISQDISEGPQECLLWKLKDSENPFCKVIDEPSMILGGDTYNFDGDKARKKCVCFEKDPHRGIALFREFQVLYLKGLK